MNITENLTDTITSPQVALPVTSSTVGFNILGLGVPEWINIGMGIYIILLLIHKVWQMYQDWKKAKQDESS